NSKGSAFIINHAGQADQAERTRTHIRLYTRTNRDATRRGHAEFACFSRTCGASREWTCGSTSACQLPVVCACSRVVLCMCIASRVLPTETCLEPPGEQQGTGRIRRDIPLLCARWYRKGCDGMLDLNRVH